LPKLHYLYEQVGGGKEHFVYYCSNCSCVLEVRRVLWPADSRVGLCRGCGRPLQGGVECRLAPIPEEWSDVFVDPVSPLPKNQPLFLPASSLPHFSLGFPRLDKLLRPLEKGRLFVFGGSQSSIVAELAAFRAQLPVETGGLNSTALFIDGGNNSDPYLFSSFARQKGLRPASAMRRVASCRVFTFYQLAALVSEHLLRAVEDYGTSLVIISDLLGTFNEPELEEREARRVLAAIEEGIGAVKKRAITIVTIVSRSKYDAIVESWADAVVHLSADGDSVRAELLKHRNRVPGLTTFKMDQLLKAAKTEGLR
jgi:hypothetical protein